MVPQKRVAIYARVSTVDKRQDPKTQLMALREYAERRGFQMFGEYIIVLVWRYDRFARATQALVQALKAFQSLGVDFISSQENIDTTTPPGEMIFTVMASLAQFESALISERVKAGVARTKAQAKRLSRARLAQDIQERIATLYGQGVSIHQISRQLGVGYGTAWNYVQDAKHSLPS